jgi:hypothetical protein
LGNRPHACDFALFGQLSQLCLIDPPAVRIAQEQYPRCVAWTLKLEDLSGFQLNQSNSWNFDALSQPTLRALLKEIGDTYGVFMLANYDAFSKGSKVVNCSIKNQIWTQPAFKYQKKCVDWIRLDFAALAPADQQEVLQVLQGTPLTQLVRGESKL